MLKNTRIAYAIASLLLISGCQSYLPPRVWLWVPASTGAGGMVHGAARGELAPAAAQRIVLRE